eukprot:TRINITY_DN1536_c0_g2_i1.p1 TRINITY_DN1536_c0_g2~~TRINITY_DN1536_c0_g2_i1.p1  ORF type:complete len:779 (-),score=159.81 TRINITY_DN1536_c0_g2_i1:150-2486(-)
MMGSIPMNPDTAWNNGWAERNYQMQDEHKEVRDGAVGEGQGLSEEDESRINEVAGDVNDGCGGAIIAQAVVQRQQQPPQGPIVRWERFLPLRSLKVLLVENDDSTRHVVSALLRNCSYEVTSAANGLHAWKIIEDLTNHIDIVLTEVVIPCLSGIALLSKIMSHKTCKNIPVIMMSSHDSMGIVFKCLSKGAADFLVKPIRKNELKNLWQHVWRKCQSSSGSGSESGIQTQKSLKSKSVDDDDNNTGSNDEDDNGSIGLNVRNGSDNGSGTQSSWTKRAIEVDSPRPVSPWDQLDDPHDSTCAPVIHPKPETFCNEWVPTAATGSLEHKEQLLENVKMGKDLEIGIPMNPDIHLKSYPSEKVSINPTGSKQDKMPERDPKEENEKLNERMLELNRSPPISELRAHVVDLIGTITNRTNAQMEAGVGEGLKSLSNKDKAICDTKDFPSLELSLKRLRSVRNDQITAHDDRNVLRRSDHSAFSRYNTAAAATQAPTGFGGSYSLPLDNSSAVKNFPSNQDVFPLNQRSSSSSNNNDMGSIAKNVFTRPASAFVGNSASILTSKSLCSSAFQPSQHSHNCPPQQLIPEKVDVKTTVDVVGQATGSHGQVQVQHHHHHYHHHHHHVHSMQQLPPEHNDLSLENMAAATQQCGSSNMFAGPMEGNGGNCSLNSSIPVSSCGKNGQCGSSTATNAGGMNMESDKGPGGKDPALVLSGSGVDQNRFTQREAALNKFRQKRKERCFEKKVRYQSRKKLAEQRPRVRGQFVRQTVHDHTSQDADPDC